MKERQGRNDHQRDERMRQVLQTLEQGIETILTSEGYQQYLATMSRFHGYSFNNVALIMCQRPEATHVAGFHTWRSMERFVKKGERGITIMVPYKAKIAKEDDDPLYVIRGFGVGTVFDTLSRDSIGRAVPRRESVREYRAPSHGGDGPSRNEQRSR